MLPVFTCFTRSSEFRVAGNTRVCGYVAYVGYSGDEHHHAFKAKTESGMRHSAEAAQIQEPPVRRAVHIPFTHFLFKHVKAVFAFAAANYFAYAGNENVHAAHGFPVIIEFHIECGYFFGFIVKNYRFFEIMLNEETLVFGIKVNSP